MKAVRITRACLTRVPPVALVIRSRYFPALLSPELGRDHHHYCVRHLTSRSFQSTLRLATHVLPRLSPREQQLHHTRMFMRRILCFRFARRTLRSSKRRGLVLQNQFPPNPRPPCREHERSSRYAVVGECVGRDLKLACLVLRT